MKKTITILAGLILSLTANTQIPTGEFARYEFTNGSTYNTAPTDAVAFSGVPGHTLDRGGNTISAVSPVGVLNGPKVGTTSNVNNSTLAFWINSQQSNSTARVLQMYGYLTCGYKVETNNGVLNIGYKASSGTAVTPQTFAGVSNICDATWHHIAVRTTAINSDTELQMEVFVDGILNANLTDVMTFTGVIDTFLVSASLMLNPTSTFTGVLDDIYLYNSSLTDTEIQQIYNASIPTLDCTFSAGKATNANNSVEGLSQNSIIGNKFTLYDSGYLTSLDLFGFVNGDSVQLAIYEDNNGIPGNLITFSEKDTLKIGKITLPTPSVYLNAGDYWILGNASATHYTYTATIGGNVTSYYQISVPFGTFPSNGNSFTSYPIGNMYAFGMTVTNNTTNLITVTESSSYTSPSGNYTWTTSGTYYDTIPNANGCDSIITIDLTINVGIDEFNGGDLSSSIVIYPNPTNGNVTIKTNETINQIEVLNITGKIVMAVKSTNQLNISDLENGVYFIRIKLNTQQIITKRIMKV